MNLEAFKSIEDKQQALRMLVRVNAKRNYSLCQIVRILKLDENKTFPLIAGQVASFLIADSD